MRTFTKPLRSPWVVAAIVLALVGLGGAAQLMRTVSHPYPERFAPGVLYGATARDQVLASPVARTYLRHFRTQESMSSCGPSSVLNVLTSIGVPIADEHALFDGKTWEWLGMRLHGMTLDDLAALVAERHIGDVTVLRDLSFEAFLNHVRQSNSLGNRYIVNFDRAPLFGVPFGHFSPIGGYDAERDLVTILDVNPGYGPSLVPSQALYAAVQTIDSATGRHRGLVRISHFTGIPDPLPGHGH